MCFSLSTAFCFDFCFELSGHLWEDNLRAAARKSLMYISTWLIALSHNFSPSKRIKNCRQRRTSTFGGSSSAGVCVTNTTTLCHRSMWPWFWPGIISLVIIGREGLLAPRTEYRLLLTGAIQFVLWDASHHASQLRMLCTVGQVKSSHYSDEVSQRSQVPRTDPFWCSLMEVQR